MKRVVVTGIGLISPLGIGTRATWENLLSGQCAIGPIKAFDGSRFACSLAGEVPPYKIGDHVPKSYRKATKVMARDIELAVIAADDAMKDAGLQTKAYVDSRVKYYETHIGDLITDLAENDGECVVDRLQWLLINDKQFRQNVREFARLTREKY